MSPVEAQDGVLIGNESRLGYPVPEREQDGTLQ
jgi:hypothetical protein